MTVRTRAAEILAAVALTAGFALGAHPASAQIPGVSRTALQRHDLSAAGREAVQDRIDLAPGAVAPRHKHPGEEIIYVLEGVLEYQVGDRPWTTYKAGDVLFIPAGVAHAARNTGAVTGAELATYVVEKGKPLLQPAP